MSTNKLDLIVHECDSSYLGGKERSWFEARLGIGSEKQTKQTKKNRAGSRVQVAECLRARSCDHSTVLQTKQIDK